MAARNLEAFGDVRVVVEAFEDWDAEGRRFDLIYAATSWHWIDPKVGFAKAASLLKLDGRLAFFSASHAWPEDTSRISSRPEERCGVTG